MWRMLQADCAEDFVIATGETHPLELFVKLTFGYLTLDWARYIEFDPALMWPLELTKSAGNASKARSALGWHPSVKLPELVKRLIGAETERRIAVKSVTVS